MIIEDLADGRTLMDVRGLQYYVVTFLDDLDIDLRAENRDDAAVVVSHANRHLQAMDCENDVAVAYLAQIYVELFGRQLERKGDHFYAEAQ